MKLRPPFRLFKNKTKHNSQLEKRLEKRHLSHFSATVSQENTQQCIATVLNFSKSGLAVLATKAIPIHEILTIQLAFNSERSIQTSFKVVRCQPTETGFIIGCQLVKPDTSYTELVQKITQPKHSVIGDCW